MGNLYRLDSLQNIVLSMPGFVRFLINIGIFYWQMKKIKTFVGPRPEIAFRRFRSIRDSLVKSHYKGETRTDPCKRRTFTGGGSHFVYIWMWARIKLSPMVKHTMPITSYCRYCVLDDVCTNPFILAKPNINAIKNGEITKPIACHAAKCYHYDPKVVRFYASGHVHQSARGEDINSCLLQIKSC